jgi:radical SAM superfamily enzyme YgiQ (UPF0313 family)
LNGTINKKCNNLSELYDIIGLPEETFEYFTQRIDLFNNLKVKKEYQDTDDIDQLDEAG